MKRIIGSVFAALAALFTLVWLNHETLAKPDRASCLVVHEWGTFTSIYGSDGSILPGIERDEEPLPPFVYAHDIAPGLPQFFNPSTKPDTKILPAFQILTKGFQRPVHNATVKMETPVMYFYSPERLDAKVSVGFEGGSISQWYPARSGGETMPPQWKLDEKGNHQTIPIDFADSYQGSIEWELSVEPRTTDTDFEVMKPGELPNWLHPRSPRSNLLRTANGETETYLFYRGLGNFKQPIHYRIDGETLAIETEGDIPHLLVLDIESADYGRILWSGQPGRSETVELAGAESGFFRDEVYRSLKDALVDAGLYSDEASAMLRTWWDSYFGQRGLRAFWIVPRRFTDEILPIDIEPVPDEIERVLLGRSEILTPEFEERLVEQFAKEPDENAFRYDRYFPAYEARVEMLGGAAND